MPNRIIVPDNSAIYPGFFPDSIEFRGNQFDLSKRAEPLVDAIAQHKVSAVAPDALIYEFTKTVAERVSPRRGDGAKGAPEVRGQIESFLSLPITYVPAKELADEAWRLMSEENLSPPDSWYVACAQQWPNAELWLSHDHKDKLVTNALRVLPERVFLLTEHKFSDPRK